MRSVRLSHLEIVVDQMEPMERFYTGLLGFEVTDRSAQRGDGEMVFLSQDPDEHHQLVLRQATPDGDRASLLDHIAFRVGSLSELRALHTSARETNVPHIETVSHGSTWSVYLRDPEGNRIEHFVDTPWSISQPCRFEIDLSLADDELIDRTETHLRELELLD